MAKKPRPFNSGTLTEAGFRAWIIATLRRASFRWKPMGDAVKRAASGKEKNPTTGRLRTIYRCEGCDNCFPRDAVKVDHIEPVVDPEAGFQSWDEYIHKMFPEVEGFQILCEICHDIKTKNENERRKQTRKRKRS